jgi:hypothetical protein
MLSKSSGTDLMIEFDVTFDGMASLVRKNDAKDDDVCTYSILRYRVTRHFMTNNRPKYLLPND